MDNTRFDDELQRIFDEMMHSYLRPSNFASFYRRNTRNEIPHNNDTAYLENMRIINMLNEVMNSYNSNIYQYQNNMQSLFSIVQTMIQQREPPRNIFTHPRTNTIPIPNLSRSTNTAPRARQNNQNFRDLPSQLFTYLIYPLAGDLSGNFNRTNPFRDVLVTPTQVQINNATTNFLYSSALQLNNTSCPITLEDFQQGDNVRQIRHCGHTFGEHAIQNWFRQNVRCPVCRYDIRDYVAVTPDIESGIPIAADSSSNSLPRSSSLQNIESLIIRNISQSLNSILNNAMFTDTSNSLMYEFEFPIHAIDSSENSLDIDPVD
jgi:hypothetical protein